MKIINHKLFHVLPINNTLKINYEDIHHLLCSNLEENEQHYKTLTFKFFNNIITEDNFRKETIIYYTTRRTLINLLENIDNIKIQ